MLSADQIDRAAEILRAARRDIKVIPGLPEDCRPTSLAEAYAIRDQLIDIPLCSRPQTSSAALPAFSALRPSARRT